MSSLTLAPSADGASRGRDSVDATVQLTLPTAIPQVELRAAEVFASHPVTVHVGKWSQALPQPLHFDDTVATSCTDSPCTEPTTTAQYALHFVLALPPGFPPGYHLLWLTVPGENAQTLSSKRYAYATPLVPPKTTYRLSGDVLTIKIASVAFQLATSKRPILVWTDAGLPGTGSLRGRFDTAEAGDSVTLRHPAKTVTLTVTLRPAGHWYLTWSQRPFYQGDYEFAQMDGTHSVLIRG